MLPLLRIRTLRAAACGLALSAAACAMQDADLADAAEAAYAEAGGVTEAEDAAFTAPADSVLTPEQVDRYLRASLLQFDLVHREMPRVRQKFARMQERTQEGGVMSGLRNLAAAGSMVGEMTDLIGASYVRSARTLGYNPAEMQWVRARMGEVSAYLSVRQAQTLYEQESRRDASDPDEGAYMGRFRDGLLERVETGAARRNLDVLRETRGNVTEPMWGLVAFAGGPAGLMGVMSGLGDARDTTAARQFTEWRRLYRDALEDRVTPGLEAGNENLRFPGAS